METYDSARYLATMKTYDSARYLAKARGFVSRYEKETTREKPDAFLMMRNLSLASVYYLLALGLCLDTEQREVIAREKGDIEAKLKELERSK